jgi:hypothetical protein
MAQLSVFVVDGHLYRRPCFPMRNPRLAGDSVRCPELDAAACAADMRDPVELAETDAV